MINDNSFPPPKGEQAWSTALYIRLSRDDGDKAESNSVASQREILKEYLKQNPDMRLFNIYIDDGYSGTSFDRPAFNRMMRDIYSGAVNCVVVKDLSRFGRNYVVMGDYLDNIFVKKRVRFIALNNHHDTAVGGANPLTQLVQVGITNIMNEGQAANTSVNVRGTLNLRRKQGKFIGSFAAYGYLKDPADKHHLVVDEKAAEVVRTIFKRFIAGESIMGIAKTLNAMGLPNPSMYKRLMGFNYKHPSAESGDGLWQDSSVRRILQNRMYIGDMVQGKNTTLSYKIKQCRAIPRDEWIIVENTHEAIIDRDTFNLAQSLFNSHIRKSPLKPAVDLFSGLVRCADCKRAMNKKTNKHPYGVYSYYRCVTARKMHKAACTNHTIRIDKLEQAVLVTVQKMIAAAVDLDEVLKNIAASSDKLSEAERLKVALREQQTEREKLSVMIADLYPDWKSGIITRDEYGVLKQRLNEKLNAVDEKIASLKAAESSAKHAEPRENDFVEHFKKYGNIEKLTRPLLTELVEKIDVYEGGNIEVYFRFRDAYVEALSYAEGGKYTLAEKEQSA